MRAIVWILAAVVAFCVATSFVIVDETEQVVVTQFGKPTAVYSDAGFRLKAPAPIQRVSRFDKRRLFTETRATELLTADKKNIVVSGYVSWRINDPLAYLRAVRTREFAENRLVALVQSELGSGVGSLAFATLVSDRRRAQRPRAARARRARVERAHGRRRLRHRDPRLRHHTPQLSRRRICRACSRACAPSARASRAATDPKAKPRRERSARDADRERDEMLANARADAAEVRGEGEAEAARIYADAYAGHEALFRFLRTLEAYEKALNENTTIVLPADSPFLELLTARLPGVRPGDPSWPGTR